MSSELGCTGRRHGRKLHPWVVRLVQATRGLDEDVRARDRWEVVLSIEDVAFWQGRVICDLLGSDGFAHGVSSVRIGKAFAEASHALSRARRFLFRP